VNNTPNQKPDFPSADVEQGGMLWHYIQSMHPETISQLSKPSSPEVLQAMEQNIVGMLGHLPSEHFDVMITTNRENLGRLLAGAMMGGYFLRNAEQRLSLEKSLQPQGDHFDSSENPSIL